MAAMTSFHSELGCCLVCERTVSSHHLSDIAHQFLILHWYKT